MAQLQEQPTSNLNVTTAKDRLSNLLQQQLTEKDVESMFLFRDHLADHKSHIDTQLHQLLEPISSWDESAGICRLNVFPGRDAWISDPFQSHNVLLKIFKWIYPGPAILAQRALERFRKHILNYTGHIEYPIMASHNVALFPPTRKHGFDAWTFGRQPFANRKLGFVFSPQIVRNRAKLGETIVWDHRFIIKLYQKGPMTNKAREFLIRPLVVDDISEMKRFYSMQPPGPAVYSFFRFYGQFRRNVPHLFRETIPCVTLEEDGVSKVLSIPSFRVNLYPDIVTTHCDYATDFHLM